MIRPGNAILILWCHIFLLSSGLNASPDINVIYPAMNSNIAAVDSTFIFGSVTPGASLEINGYPIPVHKEGGFIAFIPVKPGQFSFELIAIQNIDTARLLWLVNVPEPMKPFGYDSLAIVDRGDYYGNLLLSQGDMLRVHIQGTPGCVAYFSIPGYVDSVPMAEMTPPDQPYWGEAVFGSATMPGHPKFRGIYAGFLSIGSDRLIDSSRIYYHLCVPGFSTLVRRLINTPAEEVDFNALSLFGLNRLSRLDSSNIFISINPEAFPRTVEFIDSVQIIRISPKKGYLSIFQPAGIKALAVGRDGDWIKLRLSATQEGWVESKSVRFLDAGWPPPQSYLKSVRTRASSRHLTVEFPLSDRHPFRIEEEDSRTVKIYLYGVTSDVDWIRYDFADRDLKLATWAQTEPGLYCLRLEFAHRIWGYDCFYEGSLLKLQVNKVSQETANIKDMKIIIDPGHSADPGAVGPTGLKESEANLNIALALKEELQKKGAQVILTRDDMSNLPLNDRPKIAVAANADLFISIHNNALPDGINPFLNNGVSTYYYHPHSIALARAIQDEMPSRTGLKDYGLYYGNLAVNRPTQFPAVLVECAFIILPEQEALLRSAEFRKKTAKSIRKGIEKFLEEYWSE